MGGRFVTRTNIEYTQVMDDYIKLHYRAGRKGYKQKTDGESAAEIASFFRRTFRPKQNFTRNSIISRYNNVIKARR